VASTTSFRLFSSTSTTTNGLVAATAPPGSPVAGGAVGGNGGFVVAGTSTVATPGAAGRAAQVVSRFLIILYHACDSGSGLTCSSLWWHERSCASWNSCRFDARECGEWKLYKWMT
jgi:hypothetical protein